MEGSSAPASTRRREITIYENQRQSLIAAEWSSDNLTPIERSRWSDGLDGTPTGNECVGQRKDSPLLLEHGWKWADANESTAWRISRPEWQYGGVRGWPEDESDWKDEQDGRKTLVRRRRWTRACILMQPPPEPLGSERTKVEKMFQTEKRELEGMDKSSLIKRANSIGLGVRMQCAGDGKTADELWEAKPAVDIFKMIVEVERTWADLLDGLVKNDSRWLKPGL